LSICPPKERKKENKKERKKQRKKKRKKERKKVCCVLRFAVQNRNLAIPNKQFELGG